MVVLLHHCDALVLDDVDNLLGSLDGLVGVAGRAEHNLHVLDVVGNSAVNQDLAGLLELLLGLEDEVGDLLGDLDVVVVGAFEGGDDLVELLEGLDLLVEVGLQVHLDRVQLVPDELGGERAVEAAVEVGLRERLDDLGGDLGLLSLEDRRDDDVLRRSEAELGVIDADLREVRVGQNARDVDVILLQDAEGGVERIGTDSLLGNRGEEAHLETVVEESNNLGDGEVELVLDEHVLVGQQDVRDSHVVGARNAHHPLVEEPADRVVGDLLDGFGVDVARDAALDADALVHAVLLQLRVLLDGNAVADTGRAAVLDGIIDRLPARCLAAVQCAVHTALADDVERLFVELGREALLGTSKVEADNALGAVSPCNLGDLGSDLGRHLAHGAHEDADGHREACERHRSALADSLHDSALTQPLAGVEDWAEAHFEVAHAIVVRVFAKLIHCASESVWLLQDFVGDVETLEVLDKRLAVLIDADAFFEFDFVERRQFNALDIFCWNRSKMDV